MLRVGASLTDRVECYLIGLGEIQSLSVILSLTENHALIEQGLAMNTTTPTVPEPAKPLPTAPEVAQMIGAAVHNSSSNVIMTDAQLKEISGRDKLREGFVQPVLDALNAAGFTSTRSNGITTVLVPKHDAISLSEALEISREAQNEGWRQTPGGESNDVMFEK